MVAKANNEGRSTTAAIKSPSVDNHDQNTVLTDRERQLMLKCVRLIQGNIPSKVGRLIICEIASYESI